VDDRGGGNLASLDRDVRTRWREHLLLSEDDMETRPAGDSADRPRVRCRL